jgi:hypothetical protein
MGLPKLRVLNVVRVGQTYTQSEVPSPLPIGKMHKQDALNGVVVSNADCRVRIPGKSWSFSEGLALD